MLTVISYDKFHNYYGKPLMITLKCLLCNSNLTGKKIKYCSNNCEKKYNVEKKKENRQENFALIIVLANTKIEKITVLVLIKAN